MQMFLLDSFLPPSSLLLPTRCDNIWLGDCHLFFSNAKTMLLTAACMLDFGKPKKVPFLLIIGSAMSITCLDKAKLFPEATFLLYLKSKRAKGYSAMMTSTTAIAPKFSHTLTLFQAGGGGQILSNFAEVHPIFFHSKDELISKCPFGVIVWTKIPT